ncbi:MAG: metalloregulator ArsR/SmtB family transcription factor, partial [Candidatus Caldarchaeum sp.]|nr:metalloregulator ArsR/SmtB family transcription factor [Candidatus Caldarchaeum sp.]
AELSEEFYETLAEFCKSHANPKRLRILHLLMAGEKSVGELCQLTGLSQPTISQHLSFMRKTGVVRARREGNAVFYSLADKRVAQACSILSQIVAERIKASR